MGPIRYRDRITYIRYIELEVSRTVKELYKGLEPGKLHIITARTGIGKSLLIPDYSHIERRVKIETINSIRIKKGFKPI